MQNDLSTEAATPRPTDPVPGGGKGGLVVALIVLVLALAGVSFLWVQEKRKAAEGADASDRVAELQAQLDEREADLERARKDLRELQATPASDSGRIAELEKQVDELREERDFAERERETYGEHLIEAQRELIDVKRALVEADAKIAELESGGGGSR